jgi:hypothetical protein
LIDQPAPDSSEPSIKESGDVVAEKIESTICRTGSQDNGIATGTKLAQHHRFYQRQRRYDVHRKSPDLKGCVEVIPRQILAPSIVNDFLAMTDD